MAFDLKKVIMDNTKYKGAGVTDDDTYKISASMIANDPLQNYLSIIHGKPTETEITDATLGTIFHAGMEKIVTNSINDGNSEIIGAEIEMSTILTNGWELHGTADLITEPEQGRFEIHDYKLTKNYTRKMMAKEINTHSYTKQLQVLDALFRTGTSTYSKDEIVGDITLIADFFLKDSKAISHEPVHNPLQVPNKIGTEDMNATQVLFEEVIAITDSLQSYIESGQVPPECSDKWIRNVKGKVIPTRCALYCGHGKNSLCPYYNPGTQETVSRLTNW